MKDYTVGAACALVNREYGPNGGITIYLSQRKGPYETGKYSFPGGMVDSTDKTVRDVMVRELKEETGLDIQFWRVVNAELDSWHIGGKSDLTKWFIVELMQNEVPMNTEPHKHSDWVKYTLNDAYKLPLMVSTKDILNKLSLRYKNQ